ncbi:MAG: glycosyl hydrolase family 65 protein [Tepidisphaeraceae bacterium]
MIASLIATALTALLASHAAYADEARPLVLKADTLRKYVETLNKNDRELFPQHIPNAAALEFLKKNIPLLDCPDKEIEEIYYFRWWTFRKHIKQTPDGFVMSEFLPTVGWAGKHNTISCAAGHHLHEGRWLNEAKYLDDYSTFWFRKGGAVRSYSFWAADSVWARFLVTGDDRLIRDLLPDLIANYEAWEKTHRDANGLYWQIDDRDGMEVSIGGSGYRATINSYMYGDAVAIAKMADRMGQKDVAEKFRSKAAEIKRLTQERLWDAEAQFFKVLPRGEGRKLADVREEHGLTPWYFGLPEADKSAAWKQLMDPRGFYAPFGPTTAEQRHGKFALAYTGHECQWNGPSWPYATAVTLTGMANLLNDYQQDAVNRRNYLDILQIYTKSHRLKLDDGRVVPWIDENLNPLTGDWISRTRLKSWKNGTWDAGKGGEERGKDYNHSTYCDLVINGLIGLRPRADETVEVNPLVPEGAWDYFCLDQVYYHGRWLTILFDKTGGRYGKGKGLRIFADGVQIAASDRLERITGSLGARPSSAANETTPVNAGGDARAPIAVPPETTGGWLKHEKSPVMGGKYGTCFDISVLREGDKYRMWLSWRPKKSVAIVDSADGITWSEPPRIVLPPRKETGWEDDINRPVVLKRGDAYHMWYTGQAKGHSAIGYATSPDGITWTRVSDQPVLSAEQPWEKVAVMCPHVIWDEVGKLFRMWYSGGEQNEPNAIGYATSPDGLVWTKRESNPVFVPDPKLDWEKHKVTACQVEKRGDWYIMFYIGFRDEPHAQIGIARSKDGITNWQRHPANPIIRPGLNKWDHDACYKPYAIFDGKQWLLWYNGRHGSLEQIGVVVHEGEDLGFEEKR